MLHAFKHVDDAAYGGPLTRYENSKYLSSSDLCMFGLALIDLKRAAVGGH